MASFDKEPTFKSNLLVFENRYYLIGEEHKEFTADKMAASSAVYSSTDLIVPSVNCFAASICCSGSRRESFVKFCFVTFLSVPRRISFASADYTLVAGLHRLEAAKLLGWTEVECTVCGLDRLHAELAETC